MSQTVFDRTQRDAVDATAAKVMRSGIRHEPYGKPLSIQHWEVCPPLVDPNKLFVHVDLTGRTFGRFTVMGMSRDIRGREDTGGRWIVRCACGDYEVRTAKSIKNPNNANDMCHICRKAIQTKRFRDHLQSL